MLKKKRKSHAHLNCSAKEMEVCLYGACLDGCIINYPSVCILYCECSRHLNFLLINSMQVSFAAQTLSKSVPVARRTFREMGHAQFQDCEATMEFIEVGMLVICIKIIFQCPPVVSKIPVRNSFNLFNPDSIPS